MGGWVGGDDWIERGVPLICTYAHAPYTHTETYVNTHIYTCTRISIRTAAVVAFIIPPPLLPPVGAVRGVVALPAGDHLGCGYGGVVMGCLFTYIYVCGFLGGGVMVCLFVRIFSVPSASPMQPTQESLSTVNCALTPTPDRSRQTALSSIHPSIYPPPPTKNKQNNAPDPRTRPRRGTPPGWRAGRGWGC